MAYCTRTDIEAKLPESDLQELTQDVDGDNKTNRNTRITDAIAWADAIIDSYVGQKYTVPLTDDISYASVELYYMANPIGNAFNRACDMCRVTEPLYTEYGSTWLTYDGVTGWTPGGDFVEDGKATVIFPSSFGVMLWDTTDIFKVFQSDTSQVADLMPKFQIEGRSLAVRANAQFASREHTTLSWRPKATIEHNGATNLLDYNRGELDGELRGEMRGEAA